MRWTRFRWIVVSVALVICGSWAVVEAWPTSSAPAGLPYATTPDGERIPPRDPTRLHLFPRHNGSSMFAAD